MYPNHIPFTQMLIVGAVARYVSFCGVNKWYVVVKFVWFQEWPNANVVILHPLLIGDSTSSTVLSCCFAQSLIEPGIVTLYIFCFYSVCLYIHWLCVLYAVLVDACCFRSVWCVYNCCIYTCNLIAISINIIKIEFRLQF